VKEIQFSGYAGRQITAQYQHQNKSEDLVVLFPGMGYGSNHPVYYFIRQFLTQCKIDYVFFEYNWSNAKTLFDSTETEALERVQGELSAGISVLDHISYQRLHAIGKSLGTFGIEAIMNSKENPTHQLSSSFWLTPFINTPKLPGLDFHTSHRSHFYVGTYDTYYQESVYAYLRNHAEVKEYSGMDHCFEIKGDVRESLNAVTNVVADIIDDLAEVLHVG
jgi:hypothetical protein